MCSFNPLHLLTFFAACSIFTAQHSPVGVCLAETVTLRADGWYPYNGDPKSETPGFIIEIAKTVFTEAGITIDYQLMPWARAIKEAESGKINGIVGAAHGDAPSFIFPKEAVGVSRYAFYTLPSSSWQYSNENSLATSTVGYISDYSYGETFDNYRSTHMKDNKLLIASSGDTALEQLIKMLKKGRITAIISSPEVFAWTVKSEGLKLEDFRLAGELPEVDSVHIAFSPKNPNSQKYADLLAGGVSKLRESGQLAKILSRYNVADWK